VIKITFILVHSLESNITKRINDWINGRTRKNLKSYFIEHFDTRTFLMEANGELLSLLWSLKKRYNNNLDIFIIEPLYERDLPKKILEVIECLIKSPRTRMELKKVRNLKIECSVNLRME
jgi:hypothetical protein